MTKSRAGAGLMTAAGLAAAGLAAMAMSGCAARYLAVDETGRTTAVAPPAPTTPMAGDTCGAAKLQYLIGKPQTQIPVPADLSSQRVACTTCILSHLDDPRRTTILFDAQTGLVTSVKCQ